MNILSQIPSVDLYNNFSIALDLHNKHFSGSSVFIYLLFCSRQEPASLPLDLSVNVKTLKAKNSEGNAVSV